MADGPNPIKKITYGSTTITTLPCPSSYVWKKEDISKNTAGRNENGYMYKEKLQEIVALELSWAYLTTADVHTVLTAFNSSEYFTVEYLDPLNGTNTNDYFTSKEFYVGDMTSPLYNSKIDRWTNVSFNIIARGVNT